MTRPHPLTVLAAACATVYACAVTCWLLWLARAAVVPAAWPFLTASVAIPVLAGSIVFTVYACFWIAGVFHGGGGGSGDRVADGRPDAKEPEMTLHKVQHGPAPTVQDSTQWANAYERLCRVAAQYDGALSFGKAGPHFGDRPRTYWQWMIAGELVRTGQVRRASRNMYLLVDWRATERRIHHGLIVLAPYPRLPPPVITVYLRPPNIVTRSNMVGTVAVGRGEVVYRGVVAE